MKGVILAGGNGTRLRPLTEVVNKHLLPVYNKTMVEYPLNTLKKAGITEILLITGGEHIGAFMNYLGSGKKFGVNLTYKIQDDAGGIAQAISLAENFVGSEKFVVILGDNILEENIDVFVSDFEKGSSDAVFFFKEVPDPQRYGVPVFENGNLVDVEEKPKQPKSNLAQVGLYFYTSKIFEMIKTLKPSARGEIEVTDLNSALIKTAHVSYEIIGGFWLDAGTVEALAEASNFLREKDSKFLKQK